MDMNAGGDMPSLPLKDGALWQPDRTGNYGKDCETGRAAADSLLQTIEETQNPCLFGTVVRAMVEGGVFGGVEAGFCSVIGIKLIGLVD